MNISKIEKYNEEIFDEFLDNTYGNFQIGSSSFPASKILHEFDPIAYDCMKADMDEWVFECGECGKTYDYEDIAEDCCKIECEICGEFWESEDEAIKCCQTWCVECEEHHFTGEVCPLEDGDV